VLQHHGDIVCPDYDGGLDCLGSQYHDAPFRMTAAASLKVSAQINDVRTAGSPPLQWYYQLSARVSPPTARPARSLHSFTSPIKPSGGLGTFDVNPHHDGLAIASNRLPDTLRGASLKWAKIHTHARAFQELVLVARSPTELGLHRAAPLRSLLDRPYAPVSAQAAGYADNRELRDALLQPLSPGEVVLWIVGRLANVSGEVYDRQAEMHVLPAYTFPDELGEWTSLIFTGPVASYEVPEVDSFPLHASIWLEYTSTDNQSWFTITMNIPGGHDMRTTTYHNSLMASLVLGSPEFLDQAMGQALLEVYGELSRDCLILLVVVVGSLLASLQSIALILVVSFALYCRWRFAARIPRTRALSFALLCCLNLVICKAVWNVLTHAHLPTSTQPGLLEAAGLSSTSPLHGLAILIATATVCCDMLVMYGIVVAYRKHHGYLSQKAAQPRTGGSELGGLRGAEGGCAEHS